MVNVPVAPRPVTATLDPRAPLAPAFRRATTEALEAFVAVQTSALAAIGSELAAVNTLASRLLAGGKRLRPAFCVWGYVAANGLPDHDALGPLIAAAASLDVLHVSALVHDDVMDASDLRRGQPAAHRQFETLHADAGWVGDPVTFGRAAAILLGDLLVMWSAESLHRAGLDPRALRRALPIVEAMRTEVTCGQYLDIVAQAQPLRPNAPDDDSAPAGERSDIDRALDEANRVVEFKSARYTVQRPAQFGAALGGGDARLHDALEAYGSPLGRAFQFRDDLLGVFGDSALTGKPTGDDLREGKRTVLVAHAFANAGRAGRDLLAAGLGDPTLDEARIADLQQVIVDSGARDAVEAMIRQGYEKAVSAVRETEMTDDGRTGLIALADASVTRTF